MNRTFCPHISVTPYELPYVDYSRCQSNHQDVKTSQGHERTGEKSQFAIWDTGRSGWAGYFFACDLPIFRSFTLKESAMIIFLSY